MKLSSVLFATLLLSVSLFLGGCGTPGGVVVGPVSYWTSGVNEGHMLTRGIENGQLVPAAKKPALLQAVQMGSDRPALAVGFGLDVVSLITETYTWQEIVTQIGGVLGDAALYTGAGLVINSLVKSGSSSSSPASPAVPNVSITGSRNNTTIVTGNNNTPSGNPTSN